ncbi:MAG: hypothetical protein KAS82_01335, partial [Bacteroidales bacterium]|nr:hypothetical protein [Bacteroidales bacterium]
MKQLIVLCLAGLLMACSADNSLNQGPLVPGQLTCEYLENPSVVDQSQPRLSWINMAREGERGERQIAWQVRVASSKEQLEQPDLWDSEKQLSNQSIRVKYRGKTL